MPFRRLGGEGVPLPQAPLPVLVEPEAELLGGPAQPILFDNVDSMRMTRLGTYVSRDVTILGERLSSLNQEQPIHPTASPTVESLQFS